VLLVLQAFERRVKRWSVWILQFVRDGELFRAVAIASPDGHKVTSTVGRLLDSDESLKTTKCNRTQEWKELANVVDRLFFAIVFTLMTISVMIIVLVPFYKEELHATENDDEV